METVASVASCTATACSYNHDGCTAFAITVGGSEGSATCGTFITLDARGGLPVAQGRVGACQRLECAHNADLLCTNSEVSMVGDRATCESYQVA